jgi:YmgG-like glycine-zipper protein
MRKRLLALALASSFITPAALPAATRSHHRYANSYTRHKAHRKTIKRVGIGAAGGAAIGALAGGGKGAGIGALAGGAGGYLYDRHKKHQGKP